MLRRSLLCLAVAQIFVAESAMSAQKEPGSAVITLNNKHCIEYAKSDNIFNLFRPIGLWGMEICNALNLSENDRCMLRHGFELHSTPYSKEVTIALEDRPFSVQISSGREGDANKIYMKLVEIKKDGIST